MRLTTMLIVECSKCGKPFRYWEDSPGGPFRDRETIDCPHCGGEHGAGVTAGVFRSEKLTPEEEAAFLSQSGT
jgi:endogenous inhibitor of DNA gyrase (YacG/DUF329 family)